MLSKSLGQILRVLASLHVLFHYFSSEQSQEPLPDIITDEAVKAAMNFVEVCCQQTAFIAGRGRVEEEIAVIKDSYSGTCTKYKFWIAITCILIDFPYRNYCCQNTYFC